jgi:hypothetical protein
VYDAALAPFATDLNPVQSSAQPDLEWAIVGVSALLGALGVRGVPASWTFGVRVFAVRVLNKEAGTVLKVLCDRDRMRMLALPRPTTQLSRSYKQVVRGGVGA